MLSGEFQPGGISPVLILQNNAENHFTSTTIVAPITSVSKKKSHPTHIFVDYDFLESKSVVMIEQLRTIDKQCLFDYLGQISQKDMQKIEVYRAINLGMKQNKLYVCQEVPITKTVIYLQYILVKHASCSLIRLPGQTGNIC